MGTRGQNHPSPHLDMSSPLMVSNSHWSSSIVQALSVDYSRTTSPNQLKQSKPSVNGQWTAKTPSTAHGLSATTPKFSNFIPEQSWLCRDRVLVTLSSNVALFHVNNQALKSLSSQNDQNSFSSPNKSLLIWIGIVYISTMTIVYIMTCSVIYLVGMEKSLLYLHLNIQHVGVKWWQGGSLGLKWRHVTCSTICHLQPLIPIEASDVDWTYHTTIRSRSNASNSKD